MSNYHYSEIGGLKSPKGESIVIPQFSRTAHRSTDDLVHEMHHHCGLPETTLKTALMALAKALPCLLSQGDRVTIDGVGTLRPTLRMKGVETVDEPDEEGNMVHHNATHIEFGKVLFRPAPQLTSECRRRCHPHHDKFVADQHPMDTPLTLDERIILLHDHLVQNKLIHVKEYMRLTGLRETTARKELDTICASHDFLIKTGAGTHKYYVLR